MPKANNPEKVCVDGVWFPPKMPTLAAQLFLFRFAPKMEVDPYWRPNGKAQEPYTGGGRFAHCRLIIEKMMPSFEWHEWSEEQIRVLCEHNQVAMCGSAGCVLGSTRLWNPTTNESPTFAELHASNARPTVMTLSGPVVAEVPYIKGFDSMYEIVLSTGERFTATKEHRVLAPHGYVRVKELSVGDLLFGFSPCPLDSTSDIGPLVHAQDAHRCSQKAEGCQDDYRPSFCSNGEQPLSEEVGDRQFPPSQTGALKFAPFLQPIFLHIRLLLSFVLRSIYGFLGQAIRKSIFLQSRSFLKTLELDGRLFQQPFLSPQGERHLRTSSELHRPSYRKPEYIPAYESRLRLASCQSPSAEHQILAQSFLQEQNSLQVHELQTSVESYLFSLLSTVSLAKVESITYVGEHQFFDIGVPKAHHYFAEGAIHHNSGKSASSAAYALVFAMSGMIYKNDDEGGDTAVLVISTTIDAAIRRIWKSIIQFYGDMQRRSGGSLSRLTTLGKPRPAIRLAPKDLMHGIFVVPVAAGDIQKGVNELKGFHPKRLLIIGDETDSISQAVVEVQDNLRVGTEEFQTVWLGNLPSIFNPLGNLMEPAPNTPVSEACGLEWTSTTGVHCRRFDGELSPNIVGEEKWRGLPRQRDIDASLKRNHGVKGQQYYAMIKGLPAPEGVDDVVVNEATLNKFNARGSVTWQGAVTLCAALDPGFGGDPCVLKLVKYGNDTQGKLKVAVSETIEIPITANDPNNPAEYQIAKRIKEVCTAKNIAPQDFILDSTGIGRGTAAVLMREWHTGINVCEFGGSASTKPVSTEDPRPCKDVYDRLVTELWFAIREFVSADMIRELDIDTARELTQRPFEVKNRKFSVMSKQEMRSNGVKSPNHADAFACFIELLRRKGINASPTGAAINSGQEEWDKAARDWSLEDREDAYSESY